MRRRPLLATLGASIAGAAAGCLGALGGDDSTPTNPDPETGRHQFGYDAGNSYHAPGLTGPADEPNFQQLYRDVALDPLTDDDALYFRTFSMGFDGEERWDVPVPVGSGYVAPAIYEDTVLGASLDPSAFWALSLDDGELAWQTELPEYERPGQHGSTSRTLLNGWIVVADDRAYYSTKIGIRCVDLEAREEAWHADLFEQYPGEETPNFRAPVVAHGYVFALNEPPGDDSDRLYALELGTGEVSWTLDLETDPGYVVTDPIAGDQHVLLGARVWQDLDVKAKHEAEQERRVIAVDPAAEEVAWTSEIEADYMSQRWAVADGTLFVGHKMEGDDEPGVLSGLDTADGSVVWTAETKTNYVWPVVTDDLVFVNDAYYCSAFDRETGEEVWNIVMPELLAGADIEYPGNLGYPPVVHDGRLFVVMQDHQIAGLW